MIRNEHGQRISPAHSIDQVRAEIGQLLLTITDVRLDARQSREDSTAVWKHGPAYCEFWERDMQRNVATLWSLRKRLNALRAERRRLQRESTCAA